MALTDADRLQGVMLAMGRHSVFSGELSPQNLGTILMCHFESFKDSSAYNHKIMNYGGPVVAGGKGRFGSSLYLDGGSWICAGTKDAFDFGYSNFTIEMWVNLEEDISTKRFCLFGRYENISREKFFGFELLNGKLNAFASNQTGSFTNIFHMGTHSLTWNLNQWYHVAMVKDGQIIKLYRDGEQQAINTSDRYYIPYDGMSPMPEIACPGVIGNFHQEQISRSFRGHIDELRVSSVARWSGNFSPPEKPYS